MEENPNESQTEKDKQKGCEASAWVPLSPGAFRTKPEWQRQFHVKSTGNQYVETLASIQKSTSYRREASNCILPNKLVQDSRAYTEIDPECCTMYTGSSMGTEEYCATLGELVGMNVTHYTFAEKLASDMVNDSALFKLSPDCAITQSFVLDDEHLKSNDAVLEEIFREFNKELSYCKEFTKNMHRTSIHAISVGEALLCVGQSNRPEKRTHVKWSNMQGNETQ